MKVKGVPELQRKIREFGKKAETQLKGITRVIGSEIATKASQNFASYPELRNLNEIGQSIVYMPENQGMTATIIVQQVPMGAYIEFGTGTFVEVPKGWEKIAWQFYVNGKGWMSPRPFLHPAYIKGKAEYEKQLELMLDKLTREFNNK